MCAMTGVTDDRPGDACKSRNADGGRQCKKGNTRKDSRVYGVKAGVEVSGLKGRTTGVEL